MGKVVINFSIDTEADRDLKRWLDGLPKRGRSKAIRAALREGLGHGGQVTLGDVYRAVMELERKIAAGVVLGTRGDESGREEWDVPDDVAAALDELGKV